MAGTLPHPKSSPPNRKHRLSSFGIPHTQPSGIARNLLLFSLESSRLAGCSTHNELSSSIVYSMRYYISHNHPSYIILNLHTRKSNRFHPCSFYEPRLCWLNQGFLKALHSQNQNYDKHLTRSRMKLLNTFSPHQKISTEFNSHNPY